MVSTDAVRASVRYVEVESICVNHKKLRKLSAAKISRYAYDYDLGDEFPPIAVIDCGSFYVVEDGRHRFQAQLACGYRSVAVRVVV